jgi:hypothetical protein
MTRDEALKLALKFVEDSECGTADLEAHIKEALAQPEQDGECKHCTDGCPACDARKLPKQEPVAYDKTEMNCFVQDLYDKKMQQGKHGHYETMFHVVHQAIKRVSPQRTWVGLTDIDYAGLPLEQVGLVRWAEAKLKEKNT